MNISGKSDKGKYRAENQDSFNICSVGQDTLAVVCDGMGGVAGGLLASELAAGRFLAYAKAALETSDGSEIEDLLRQATDAANRKVYRLASQKEEYAGMGTTLVAGYWTSSTAYFVNVGDSRAYRIAKDGIVQITKDHSLVQQMIDRGEITPAQGRHHPRRNIITRAVGSERFVTCDIFTVPIRWGDCYLLCSDGLINSVEEAELHRVILATADAHAACDALVTTAVENGARDNVTAVVAYSGKEGA